MSVIPTLYSWLKLKQSVTIEAKGFRFRGGSRTALVKRRLGLKPRASHAKVMAAIDAKIAALTEKLFNG